jgi:hypothetical protein
MAKGNKKYRVGKSKIQGEGVFAKKSLSPGEIVGRVHTIKKLYTDYDFTELGRKHNHSDTPNAQSVRFGDKRYLMAIEPIEKGEELVSDYRNQQDLEQPDEDFEKADNGGWLSKYENGGEYLGTTNVGRNYSPAWGGQFEDGGTLQPPMAGAVQTVPMAQTGTKQSLKDSLNLSSFLNKKFEPSISFMPRVNLSRLPDEFGINVIPGTSFTASPTERLSLNVDVDAPFMVSKRGVQGLDENNAFNYNIGADYQLGKNDYLGLNYDNNQGANLTYRHTIGNRKKKKAEAGTSLPGSVGFTYARTQDIPSEGPYAKKTLPSAQNGQEMSFYQHGLDWTPKNISEDGSEIPMAQEGKSVKKGSTAKGKTKQTNTTNKKQDKASDLNQKALNAVLSKLPWNQPVSKKPIEVQKDDRYRGDIRTNFNIKSNEQVLNEARSRARQAEKKVQKLINYKNYNEKVARRAVQNKTAAGERDLKEIERVETRAAAHPDFKPGIGWGQMQALSEAGDIRSRLLKGANLFTNTGNPVIDLATGIVTAPAKALVNLTTNAAQRYLNPENSVAQNLANLGWDLFDLIPFQMAKGFGNTTQHVIKEGITPIGYDAFGALAAPVRSILPNSWKYQPKMFAGKNRFAAWDVYTGRAAPDPSVFTRNVDGTLSINNFRLQREILDEAKNYPKNRFATAQIEDNLNFGGVHGNGMITKGVDDQGRTFMDFTDTWDIQPLKSFKSLPKPIRNFEASSLLDEGQPFKLRNRVYYDDAGNYFDDAGNKLIDEVETFPKSGDLPEGLDVNFVSTPGIVGQSQLKNIDDWNNATVGKYIIGGLTGSGLTLGPLLKHTIDESNRLKEARREEEWKDSGYEKITNEMMYDYFDTEKKKQGGVLKVNQQDEKTVQHLDQLLNFTNKPKAKNGWLDKYQ